MTNSTYAIQHANILYKASNLMNSGLKLNKLVSILCVRLANPKFPVCYKTEETCTLLNISIFMSVEEEVFFFCGQNEDNNKKTVVLV